MLKASHKNPLIPSCRKWNPDEWNSHKWNKICTLMSNKIQALNNVCQRICLRVNKTCNNTYLANNNFISSRILLIRCYICCYIESYSLGYIHISPQYIRKSKAYIFSWMNLAYSIHHISLIIVQLKWICIDVSKISWTFWD